jgi:hypothetical protein
MIPMRMSSVFKNRWMALIWAAGILWFAYDFASPPADAGNASVSAEAPTDVTGATITDEQANRFQQALNGI